MTESNVLWYMCGSDNNLNIHLDLLTDDMLDNLKPIPEYYNNRLWTLERSDQYSSCDILINMDKLMDKLIHCKKLFIRTEGLHMSKLPPNLTYLLSGNNKIDTFPDTLEEILFEYWKVIIPDNLPRKSIKITIECDNLEDNINNLPSEITYLTIKTHTINVDNIIWPNNIKYLKLEIENSSCNKNIGILPYGLEEFHFACNNYAYPLLLPPTLKKFSFNLVSRTSILGCKYKYSDCLNELPDSIEALCISIELLSKIIKFPKSCKKVLYDSYYNDYNFIKTLEQNNPQIKFIRRSNKHFNI